jgi:hypothetical protein
VSAALLTTVAVWLVGHAVLGACRASRARSAAELHATALLLGLALAPALFAALVIASGPLSPAAGRVLLVALALPGALFLAGNVRRARPAAGAAVEPWTPGQLAALAAVLSFAAFALFDAASAPMHGFDALFHYAYKGKLLAHEGYATAAWTDLDGALGRSMTHPGYPLGMPALDALVGCVRGGFDEDAARPLTALFALAPAALLACALRPRGRWPALLGALVWISLPILYYWRPPHDDLLRGAYGLVFGHEAGIERFGDAAAWVREHGVTLDGTADLPLAALFFAALLHLARALDARRASDAADVVAAGLLLGGAMSMKNEGLALAAVLLVAFGVAYRRARVPALVGALALACVAAWLVARPELPAVDEDYAARLAPANLFASLGRSGMVAWSFAAAFFDVLVWNLLWPLFFGTLAWSLARPRELLRDPAWPAALVCFGAFALYFAVLLVAPMSLARLWDTGIPARLLLHVTPVAILVTFSLLWRERGA